MRVMIAGGGIGGLTAALHLHRAGISAQVFESSAEIKALGVGINLLPHAVRELTELGLQSELAETAIETRDLIYHTQYGRPIWQEPRGLAAGYEWPQFSIHRGALQALLLAAVRKQLGPDNIVTGHHLSGFDQDGNSVTAHFIDRRDGKKLPSRNGDVLVGADGIHSAVRAAKYPNEGPPEYSGITMWRGITDTSPFLGGDTMIMAGNWNRKFVAYPISQKLARTGRSLVNWVAEVRGFQDHLQNREDWNRGGRKSDFFEVFSDWSFDWLDIPELINQADSIFEFPMIDRDPLPVWSHGRVTLLGDAAHPMYPIGSNGASQAILDARALATALTDDATIEKALKSYEKMRLGPTAEVVLSNRQFGPEKVMQLVDERCPSDCTNIHDYVSREEMEEISRKYKTLAGFDKDSLNVPSG